MPSMKPFLHLLNPPTPARPARAAAGSLDFNEAAGTLSRWIRELSGYLSHPVAAPEARALHRRLRDSLAAAEELEFVVTSQEQLRASMPWSSPAQAQARGARSASL